MRRVSFVWTVVLGCLVATLGAGAQQAPPQEQPTQQTPGTSTVIQRIIVKVNGEPFTQKDLEDRQISQLQRTGRTELPAAELTAALTAMMPEILVKAVDDLLLLQRGRELGYTMSNEVFDTMVKEIKAGQNLSDEDFARAMKEEGLSLDALRKRLEPEYIISQVQRNDVLASLKLTEHELNQYYTAHPDEFMKPPAVTVRELAVAVAAAPPPGRSGQMAFLPSAAANDQAAAQKIAELRQRAVAGEDFQKLIAEASDSPTKASGGLIEIKVADVSDLIRGELDKLQPGGITAPIKTPRGYMLLKLESRTATEKLPFEEVRESIEQKIGTERLDAEVLKYLRNVRAQALMDWKRDDLRLMYEKRLAEKTAEQAAAAAAQAARPVGAPAP
jgi:peptidyl-prolyl cis-trans isomerase SurA